MDVRGKERETWRIENIFMNMCQLGSGFECIYFFISHSIGIFPAF